MNIPLWEKVFSDAEVRVINLALSYANNFDSDARYVVIAKFVRLFDMLHEDAINDTKHDEEFIKNYLANVFGGK